MQLALLLHLLGMRPDVLYNAAAGRLPYLPFVSGLDTVPPGGFSALLLLIFGSCVPALLFNYCSRAACVLIGGGIFLEILASRPLYSTSLLFLSLLFVIVGWGGGRPGPFRWQLALLYGGAALNKAVDPDWWTGHYMRGFGATFGSPANPLLPLLEQGQALPQLLGGAVVLGEATLAVLFLVPRLNRYGIALGLCFHYGMLLLTFGRLSWLYAYLCGVAYLPLVDWPTAPPRRRQWLLAAAGFLLATLVVCRGRGLLVRLLT